MENFKDVNEAEVNEQTRPEPPKDENGNPIAPPEGFRPPMRPHGGRPPEPPKDENGNPIDPPEGFMPPMRPHGGRPPEPPKDEDGNPIAPPEGFKPQGDMSNEPADDSEEKEQTEEQS